MEHYSVIGTYEGVLYGAKIMQNKLHPYFTVKNHDNCIKNMALDKHNQLYVSSNDSTVSGYNLNNKKELGIFSVDSLPVDYMFAFNSEKTNKVSPPILVCFVKSVSEFIFFDVSNSNVLLRLNIYEHCNISKKVTINMLVKHSSNDGVFVGASHDGYLVTFNFNMIRDFANVEDCESIVTVTKFEYLLGKYNLNSEHSSTINNIYFDEQGESMCIVYDRKKVIFFNNTSEKCILKTFDGAVSCCCNVKGMFGVNVGKSFMLFKVDWEGLLLDEVAEIETENEVKLAKFFECEGGEFLQFCSSDGHVVLYRMESNKKGVKIEKVDHFKISHRPVCMA